MEGRILNCLSGISTLVLEVVAAVVVVEGEDDVVGRGGVEQLAHPLTAHLF
jgi:hypothetical protein